MKSLLVYKSNNSIQKYSNLSQVYHFITKSKLPQTLIKYSAQVSLIIFQMSPQKLSTTQEENRLQKAQFKQFKFYEQTQNESSIIILHHNIKP